MKTIKNMLFMGTLLVALSGMLVGCTEEEAAQFNADLEKLNSDGEVIVDAVASEVEDNDSIDLIPDNAQNGTVSQDLYFELLRFKNESTVYKEDQYKIITDMSKNVDVSFYSEELRVNVEEYNEFLNSFKLKPSTEADMKFDWILKDLTFQTRMANNSILEYTKTAQQSDLDKNLAYLEQVEEAEFELNNLMEEYELN